MKIKVTQEHIDKGKPRSYCDCPIALALKEQTNKTTWEVHKYYTYHNNDTCFPLPERAVLFMLFYDNDLTVSPFEFEIGYDEN